MKSSRTPNTHIERAYEELHTKRMVQHLHIAQIARAKQYDQVKVIFPSFLFVLFSMLLCLCNAFVVLMTGAGCQCCSKRALCTTPLVHTERHVESFPPSISVKAEYICGTMVNMNIGSSGQRIHDALFKNVHELCIQDSPQLASRPRLLFVI